MICCTNCFYSVFLCYCYDAGEIFNKVLISYLCYRIVNLSCEVMNMLLRRRLLLIANECAAVVAEW